MPAEGLLHRRWRQSQLLRMSQSIMSEQWWQRGRSLSPGTISNNRRLSALVRGFGRRLMHRSGPHRISSIMPRRSESENRRNSGRRHTMELSVGGDLDRVRREVIASVDIPVGNVPLYQAFCEAGRKYGNRNKLDERDAVRPDRTAVSGRDCLYGDPLRN